MRLIVIGAEYTGKTTFVQNLRQWMHENMGEGLIMIHDHFLPSIGEGRLGMSPEEEEAQFLQLSPTTLEMYMRYMIHYHLGHHFYGDNDHIVVNWYLAEPIYAPMYFGYGGPGEYADRRVMARSHDAEVIHLAPDTILLHLTATPDVIRERMNAEPRPTSRVQAADIETIRAGFREQFSHSLIRRKISLDTSTSTPEETLSQFLKQAEHHLTPNDRLRILTRKALQS